MSDTLLRLQRTQIEILDEFKKMCEKHQLKYYLFFGTLLGAVRHQGFIPWDDDIDVVMPREDYDRFIRLAPQELADWLYLESPETMEDCALSWSKVRKKNTLYLMNPMSYNKRPEEERPLGIFIDVFPLDTFHGKSLRWVDFKVMVCGFLTGHLYHYRLNESDVQATSLKSKILHKVLRWFSVKQIKQWIRSLSLGKGSRFVLMAGGDSIEHIVWPVECFEPSVPLAFGDSVYAVPKDYDRVLRISYGDDYMKLPPVEQRITHSPIRLSFDLEKDGMGETD